MTYRWLWRAVVLAWVAGIDLVLVATVAACVLMALEAQRTHAISHDASRLVLGERYIRLRG